MIKKTLGYLLLAAGLLGLITTLMPIEPFNSFWQGFEDRRNQPETNELAKLVTPDTFIFISGTIFIIGALLAFGKKGSGKQKNTEVPIYKGKDIIGYRRH
tara:strand:+ start:384 stop:683 length:300 start_codon:yes stop_codon:yes gene_type:complete